MLTLAASLFVQTVGRNDDPVKRALSIADILVHSKYDILCIQGLSVYIVLTSEVYFSKARERLVEMLKTTYPYIISNVTHPSSNKQNGLLIASRYQIADHEFIPYTPSEQDKLYARGVLTAVVDLSDIIRGKQIHIFNTQLVVCI